MTINETIGKWEVITAGEQGGMTYEHVVTGERVSFDPDGTVNMPGINGVKQIRSADDLPDPVDGYHELEDGTMYVFIGHVVSDSGLHLAESSPILGHERESCVFIYTGGETAVKGTGDVIISDVGISAPGGTVLDIDGGAESECIFDTVNFADDLGEGNIEDLGTIGTFRGPEFINTQFRDFNSGLTFNGEVHRVFINTRARDITASGVTCFDFADSFDGEIISVESSDFEHFQPDTTVVNVDPAAEPSEVFLYRGNSHDPTVSEEDILTGVADPAVSPYWVSASFPLRNSSVVGQVSLDAETVTTINTQGEWVEVTGDVTAGDDVQRTDSDGIGGIEYVGRKPTDVTVHISVSWFGAGTDTYEFGIGKNGEVPAGLGLPVKARGQNTNQLSTFSGVQDLSEGDRTSLMVRNTSGTNNITLTRYVINFTGS